MRTLIAAIAIVLLLGTTAYGAWWYPPTVVQAYYPAPPAYAYPAPVYPYAPYAVPVYAYPARVPYRVYSPIYAPAPVYYGPPGVVVRGKVYVPGRPIRNAVRAVLP